MNPSEALTIDTLVSFIVFDELGVAKISSYPDVTVTRLNGKFMIHEDNKLIYTITDEVQLPETGRFTQFY